MLNIDIIACLNDNYSYLIHNKEENIVGVVDQSEFKAVDNLVSKKYQKIDYILNTHHHIDHVDGNLELKKKYKSKVISSTIDKNRIPGIDFSFNENEKFKFGSIIFDIILVPGHTKGHIAFYSKVENVIFTGDTLFSLGCGRIFEGTANQMYDSLQKFKNLPKITKIYCGHEYTKNNLDFCLKYDFNNKELLKKSIWIKEQLNKNLPTVPTLLGEELNTNIFLRCDNIAIKNNLEMKASSDKLIFEQLRKLKDEF